MALLPVGLALSGGTARSIAHVGVIRALREAGLPIAYVAGTSGGAIVATILAAGASDERLTEIAGSVGWRDLARFKLSTLGLVSSKPIERLMNEVLPGARFEGLQLPCAVTVTNLLTGRREAFARGPLARVVRASCSIPQIYLPVEIEGAPYVDGGLAEYLPVQTVQEFGPQFTLAVNLAPRRERYARPRHYLQLVMLLTNMVAQQNLGPSLKRADFVLHPPVERFSPFDFGRARSLMDLGYETTRAHIAEIERAWRRKSSWWRRIKSGLRPAPDAR
jgi:NTE family protein